MRYILIKNEGMPEARRSFRRLQRHPTMIVNFFRHAGLDVYGLS